MIFLLIGQLFLPQVSEAAIAGKAVNQAAKKVAKEIVVDQAVQMSMQLVLDPKYRFTPTESTPQAKEGYTMVCMPRDKKSDGTCSAPVEVKKNLTTADKKAIGAKAEANLDKKITGGIGATRWGKFIDWFLPTFAVGAGAAVITAALSGELGSFFDDLAYDSLVDDGFLDGTTATISDPYKLINVTGRVDTYARVKSISIKPINQNVNLIDSRNNSVLLLKHQQFQINLNMYRKTATTMYVGSVDGSMGLNFDHLKDAIYPSITGSENYDMSSGQAKGIFSDAKITVKPTEAPDVTLPKFDETGLSPTRPPNTQTQIVAPGAIPFTKTDTGEVLIPYLKPDGTIGFKTPTGIIVKEDDVTVGDPDITYNPDGTTTVNKAPRPDLKPDPEPEPEPEPEPDPDEDGSGTGEKDPDENETPEDGPTCTDTIKLPRLGALFRTMSESFPFSLPFDLMDGFNALFAEIGKEKPKVDYTFKGFNMSQKVTITIPDYMDDWMPFIHSLMLFIFDVGILYGIYRLIRT